ncbi:MAG: copper amine oxidase N-terminal domain-containing protein [Monoglobaceae bacterium]
MKMTNRLMGLMLVFAMLFSAAPVLASDDVSASDEKVEISFCVGDETLMINGTPVTVEKPYVVGEGVTLVPLRVITEAFGAEVLWEDETRTITLNYPDISIVLQIGNPVAEVNGKAETLLAAPELPTEYTMVPLRFISETFGADVSYDDETERITVVKENSEAHTILEGAIDSSKIGDSYYKWSMENPVDMKMDTREFDGTYTSFSNENGYFYIEIASTPDDFDFEKVFVNFKTGIQGMTLVKADKNSDNPKKKTMHFQAKDKSSFLNVREIITDKYVYIVCGTFNLDTPEVKDEGIRIMDTFDLSFDGNDIYDLSNVTDGMRKFESEDLKISFNVPQDYIKTSSDNTQNYMRFASINNNDRISAITFGIYSKSEVGDAAALAQLDYDGNKKNMNETAAVFSDGISEKSYTDFNSFEYSYTLDYADGKEYSRDVFFDKGDYTYNMSVHVKLPMDNADEFIDGILNSISADTLDPNETGVLMRNDIEATGTYTADTGVMTMELPNVYQANPGNSLQYINMRNGIMISVQTVDVDRGYAFSDVMSNMKNTEAEAQKYGHTIIASTYKTIIGSSTFATLTVKSTSESGGGYVQQFATLANNTIYIVTIAYPELSYSDANRQEVMDIMKSIKIK